MFWNIVVAIVIVTLLYLVFMREKFVFTGEYENRTYPEQWNDGLKWKPYGVVQEYNRFDKFDESVMIERPKVDKISEMEHALRNFNPAMYADSRYIATSDPAVPMIKGFLSLR